MFDAVVRSLPAVLVFLTLAGTSWIWGGLKGSALLPLVPWFLAAALEVLFFLPQRRPCESMVQARERVWHRLARDPLAYVALALLIQLVIPFFNRALCPNCDAALIAAGEVASAPAPWLPYCLNVRDQAHVLTWFVPALVSALAVRHALTREGKRIFLELAVWNAAALAVFGFVEVASGAPFVYWRTIEHPMYFFATFGYPNAGGAFFTMAFAFSIGLWRTRVRETDITHAEALTNFAEKKSCWWLRAHYPLVASLIIFFAVLYTRSRAAVMLTGSLAAAAGVYAILATFSGRVSRTRRLRTIIFSAIGLLVLGVLVSIFAPADISSEMKTADLAAIADRVTGKSEWHATAAWEIFREHPFFGTGGWGYKHLSAAYAPENARKCFRQWYSNGQANVHNDYLQFLCEHGAIGAACMLALVVLLLCPVCAAWGTLYRISRFLRANEAPPKPRAVFVLPAGAFWILAGNLCLAIHAFGDCPLRGAAVLTMCLSSLAAADGFLPHDEDLSSQTKNLPSAQAEEERYPIHHHHHHHRHRYHDETDLPQP